MRLFKVLSYYMPHVRAYWLPIAGTLVIYALATIARDVAGPILYKRLFDVFNSATIPAEALPQLSATLVLIGLVIVLYQILFRVGDYLHPYAQSHIMKRLADEAFARIEKHSYAFFSGTFVGSLVSKSKRYVDSFETIHDISTFQLWLSGVSLISAIAVLGYYAPLLAWIFFGWFLFFILGSYFFIPRIVRNDIKHSSAKSRTTGALADVLSNILTVKMFARSTDEHTYFGSITAKEEEVRRHAWFWYNHQRIFQGFAVGAVEFGSMFVAITLWVNGSITVGTIVLMQIYLFSLFEIVWNIGRNTTRFLNALADAKEIIDIFEQPISVKDTYAAEECRIKDGAIAFKGVAFSYHDGADVFETLDLTIPAGQKVGLVGYSGAGKSTITKLLLRFSDVSKGTIEIDGQDIRNITQDDLRRHISYVPQEPLLFHRTLTENIRYGNPNATVEDIERVARQAHAHEFILKLSQGYDTLVGERGVKLSGGERQRVAIARAMLKDTPILILDEATSSLDSLSERYIQDAFSTLMKGRTTLIIAHRLSTIEGMDRILVFDAGRIIEDGTHTELISLGGMYAKLWKEQSRGFIGE